MTNIQDARNNVFAAETNLRKARESLDKAIEEAKPKSELERIIQEANNFEYETYKLSVGINQESVICERKDKLYNGSTITPGSNLFKVLHKNGYRIDFISCQSNENRLEIYVKKF